jgi:hypothetical protein
MNWEMKTTSAFLQKVDNHNTIKKWERILLAHTRILIFHFGMQWYQKYEKVWVPVQYFK